MASYSGSPAGVAVSLLTNTGTGGDAEGDTLSGIENLYGSDAADTLIGDADVNQFTGNDGNDTLVGDAGNDRLDGGAGDDTLVGGAGSDELYTWSGSDLVDGGEGDDLIYTSGGGGTQTITGGAGRDTLRFGESTVGELRFTDFAAETGGDILDLDSLINSSASVGAYAGGNPFDASVGVLRLVRQGVDPSAVGPGRFRWHGNNGLRRRSCRT